MPKKTAPTSEAVGEDQPDPKVTPKGEPVDLTEDPPKGAAETTVEPADQSDDLDLDTPVSEDEPDTDRMTVFTPVNAMEAFEEAMAAHPNTCLKHMLLEWKAQEREARNFEQRQRVRGDL